MSASIQFLVSAPAPTAAAPSTIHSASLHPSSPSSCSTSPSSSPPSSYLYESVSTNAEPPISSWLRTSSWARHSAVAGFTLPPIQSLATDLARNSWISTDSITGDSYLQASVRFLQDCRLNLIHIPLHLYPHFVQPILSLIISDHSSKSRSSLDSEDCPRLAAPGASVAADFINISITPVECSVVCSKEATASLFLPIIGTLALEIRKEVIISEDDFVAIQVDGEGLEAGQRVLDLTSPLALAGVPIFFITTYFSDHILVPAKNTTNVTKALQRRGFVFEKYSESFVTPPSHHRNSSSTSSFGSIPQSPPGATTLGELEAGTFDTLRKHNVVPQVSADTKLILCAGKRSFRKESEGNLRLSLVKCLVSKPQFMSVTLTDSEPVSILLDKQLLKVLDCNSDILLGSKEDVLIPIILDLRELPADSTGIVCGVAGRLAGATQGGILDGAAAVGMSYLSTARAGTVMVAEQDINRAISALNL